MIDTSATTDVILPKIVRAVPLRLERKGRRDITPQAGHALEILAHAIEYLTDEYVHEGGQLSAHDPRVQAVQLMMALNRQIYFACPVKPTWGERLRDWLRPSGL